jgi:hypothetical protein
LGLKVFDADPATAYYLPGTTGWGAFATSAGIPTAPYAGIAGDFAYIVTGTAASILGYTGTNQMVTIPSTIAGLPVTAIATNAFYNCWNLSNVTIGNNVKAIGKYAFEGCEGLTSVTIPNGVSSIGDSAFSQCTSLTSVTIANSVTNIGDFAFAACTSLTAITVAALNPVYSSLNGVLFDKGQTTLLQCPGGTTGSYAIPNTVTKILYSAFNGCARLTNIAIPNSVTGIGDNAFGGCTGLASVTIPDSVIHLGNGAFAGCSSLTNATIGCNIAASAFAYCQSLTDVTIGQSVTTIGDSAFWRCTSLMGIDGQLGVVWVILCAFWGSAAN